MHVQLHRCIFLKADNPSSIHMGGCSVTVNNSQAKHNPHSQCSPRLANHNTRGKPCAGKNWFLSASSPEALSLSRMETNLALFRWILILKRRPVSPSLPPSLLPNTGLSLILKVDQKDHIPLLSTTAGVKVMIHRHNQTPFLEHEGFDIRPGIESTIGIKQVGLSKATFKSWKCWQGDSDVSKRPGRWLAGSPLLWTTMQP